MNPTLPASLHHPLRHLWISLLLLAVPLAAEDPATTTMATDPRLIGDDLRIPDVFSTHLPQTLQSSGLRLFVHPHLGDFTSCDSLRTAAGLRYGLTENWEASIETEFYFSHGCGDVGLFDQSGFSSLAIGTKYDLGLHPFAPWHTAVGFDFNTPVSHPPPISRMACGTTAPTPFPRGAWSPIRRSASSGGRRWISSGIRVSRTRRKRTRSTTMPPRSAPVPSGITTRGTISSKPSGLRHACLAARRKTP